MRVFADLRSVDRCYILGVAETHSLISWRCPSFPGFRGHYDDADRTIFLFFTDQQRASELTHVLDVQTFPLIFLLLSWVGSGQVPVQRVAVLPTLFILFIFGVIVYESVCILDVGKKGFHDNLSNWALLTRLAWYRWEY